MRITSLRPAYQEKQEKEEEEGKGNRRIKQTAFWERGRQFLQEGERREREGGREGGRGRGEERKRRGVEGERHEERDLGSCEPESDQVCIAVWP